LRSTEDQHGQTTATEEGCATFSTIGCRTSGKGEEEAERVADGELRQDEEPDVSQPRIRDRGRGPTPEPSGCEKGEEE
jgi:hypothetical protein